MIYKQARFYSAYHSPRAISRASTCSLPENSRESFDRSDDQLLRYRTSRHEESTGRMMEDVVNRDWCEDWLQTTRDVLRTLLAS